MAEYVVTNGERLYVVLKCYVVRKSSRKSSVDPIIVAEATVHTGIEQNLVAREKTHIFCKSKARRIGQSIGLLPTSSSLLRVW
jgi:hypothetical protein